MSTLWTKHLVRMAKAIFDKIFWTVVGKCTRLADCFARTAIFLVLTLFPSLWKAICLSSQAHSAEYRWLINTQYNNRNYTNAWTNLKKFLLSWLDSTLFYWLMISNKQVDSWSTRRINICHKMKSKAKYIRVIRRHICDRGLLVLRTVMRVFNDAIRFRVDRLRWRHSNLLFALAWLLYNMIWKPPLSFMYLLCTTVNEYSFYRDLPVESEVAKRRRYHILKQLAIRNEVLINQKRTISELEMKITNVISNYLDRNQTSSPSVSLMKSSESKESCLGNLSWDEETCERRDSDLPLSDITNMVVYDLDRNQTPSPRASPMKSNESKESFLRYRSWDVYEYKSERRDSDLLHPNLAKLTNVVLNDLDRNRIPSPQVSPIKSKESNESKESCLGKLRWNEYEEKCELIYSDLQHRNISPITFDPFKINNETEMPYNLKN